MHYVDGDNLNDPSTGLVSTDAPQLSALPVDYAIGWANHYGLCNHRGRMRMDDRQWIYRHLPCIGTMGDHGIEGNHCRDNEFECNRGPGSQEESGVAEWMAFQGNMNPPPLRVDELYWARDMGPIRMAAWDANLHGMPSEVPPLSNDIPRFGATQLADIDTWMNVADPPFKMNVFECGLTRGNERWWGYHPDEAEGWHTQTLTRPNLLGQFFVSGDSHVMHIFSYDFGWLFGVGGDRPGVLAGTLAAQR